MEAPSSGAPRAARRARNLRWAFVAPERGRRELHSTLRRIREDPQYLNGVVVERREQAPARHLEEVLSIYTVVGQHQRREALDQIVDLAVLLEIEVQSLDLPQLRREPPERVVRKLP